MLLMLLNFQARDRGGEAIHSHFLRVNWVEEYRIHCRPKYCRREFYNSAACILSLYVLYARIGSVLMSLSSSAKFCPQQVNVNRPVPVPLIGDPLTDSASVTLPCNTSTLVCGNYAYSTQMESASESKWTTRSSSGAYSSTATFSSSEPFGHTASLQAHNFSCISSFDDF